MKGIFKMAHLDHHEIENILGKHFIEKSSDPNDAEMNAKMKFSTYWEEGVLRLRVELLLLDDDQLAEANKEELLEGATRKKGTAKGRTKGKTSGSETDSSLASAFED